jgi:DeoR/GlpR family transcriptional regulator of sugar metabolism
MVAEERRRSIQDYLERYGTAKASELAERLGVSTMTINRDLTLLAEQGLITKVHGGAVARRVVEVPYRDRIVYHQREKAAVAARAAELVSPGMTIYLGPGTTVTELARALPKEGLRVLTNSMPIAHELTLSSQHEILLTGGTVRLYAEALVGRAAEEAFDKEFLHYAFIAVTGVDIEAGMTVYSESEARVLLAAMRAAKSTVLLTDHSKWDRVMGPVVAPLFTVHTVICNHPVPERYTRFLKEQRVELIALELPVEVPA